MINKKTRKIIENIVDESFAKLKGEFIGPSAVSKAYVFALKNYDHENSLLAAYLHANSIHASGSEAVDRSTMSRIVDSSINYIDTLKQKSVSDITRIIEDGLQSIKTNSKIQGTDFNSILRSKEGQAILDSVREALEDQKIKLDKAVDTILNVDLSNAQNYGAADSIMAMSKNMGISDPVVFKIGVNDTVRCKHCWRLWTLDDRVTPRVYRMSELAGGYADPKNPSPSVGTTHPNCRDSLTTLLPGFGFSGGRVAYIGKGHDEYQKQRS